MIADRSKPVRTVSADKVRHVPGRHQSWIDGGSSQT